MVFSTLTIATFKNAKLYKASDITGKGWNEYGSGTIRVNFIKKSDSNGPDLQGWGQWTYHNDLTGACGLNGLIVPNLPLYLSSKQPTRITFKSRSGTIGNNGKKNMYSVKLASLEDAGRLRSILNLLQIAAKQATDGSPLAVPEQNSIEMVTAEALIGRMKDKEEELERHFVWSKLIQLAKEKAQDRSYTAHKFFEDPFFAPTELAEKPLYAPIREEHFACDYNKEENVSGSGGDDVSEGDSSEANSVVSIPRYEESQDWSAAFHY